MEERAVPPPLDWHQAAIAPVLRNVKRTFLGSLAVSAIFALALVVGFYIADSSPASNPVPFGEWWSRGQTAQPFDDVVGTLGLLSSAPLALTLGVVLVDASSRVRVGVLAASSVLSDAAYLVSLGGAVAVWPLVFVQAHGPARALQMWMSILTLGLLCALTSVWVPNRTVAASDRRASLRRLRVLRSLADEVPPAHRRGAAAYASLVGTVAAIWPMLVLPLDLHLRLAKGTPFPAPSVFRIALLVLLVSWAFAYVAAKLKLQTNVDLRVGQRAARYSEALAAFYIFGVGLLAGLIALGHGLYLEMLAWVPWVVLQWWLLKWLRPCLTSRSELQTEVARRRRAEVTWLLRERQRQIEVGPSR